MDFIYIKKLKKLFQKYILFYKTKKNRRKNELIFKRNNVKLSRQNWNINGVIKIVNRGELIIGENFRANSSLDANPIGGDTILRFIVRSNANLIIGNNVGISNSTIVCWNSIIIEDNVFIGGSCKIWDTDFHNLDPVERVHNGDQQIKTKPICIKKYAFIGGSSIILKGVTVGINSVIAAGSVVAKDVPDNEIWGGNPAKFIKKHPNPI